MISNRNRENVLYLILYQCQKLPHWKSAFYTVDYIEDKGMHDALRRVAISKIFNKKKLPVLFIFIMHICFKRWPNGFSSYYCLLIRIFIKRKKSKTDDLYSWAMARETSNREEKTFIVKQIYIRNKSVLVICNRSSLLMMSTDLVSMLSYRCIGTLHPWDQPMGQYINRVLQLRMRNHVVLVFSLYRYRLLHHDSWWRTMDHCSLSAMLDWHVAGQVNCSFIRDWNRLGAGSAGNW